MEGTLHERDRHQTKKLKHFKKNWEKSTIIQQFTTTKSIKKNIRSKQQ